MTLSTEKRSGKKEDRRQLVYSTVCPERRTGQERRAVPPLISKVGDSVQGLFIPQDKPFGEMIRL